MAPQLTLLCVAKRLVLTKNLDCQDIYILKPYSKALINAYCAKTEKFAMQKRRR